MVSLREREVEFKKQVIAEVAYQLLSSKPYEAVTVDDIARQVGCAKGTLYQYFKNKDHILSYLVWQGLDRLCLEVEEQCLKNPDVESALNNYLTLLYYFHNEHNQIFSSWSRRKMDRNINQDWIDEINQSLERKMQMVIDILDKGIAEKKFIDVDSRDLAGIMETIFRDLTFAAGDEKMGKVDPQKVLDLIKQILNQGILVR